MKMLNYLRLFEGFGLFIVLVGQCILDIRIFLLFMLMWIGIFSSVLFILNCNLPNYEDYPHLSLSWQLVITIWRDALGDLQPPVYDYWHDKQKELDRLRIVHGFNDLHGKPLIIIIYLIWVIWFFNTVFNIIIMLNFLIAFVEASYQKIMAMKNELLFAYKQDLNYEVAIFRRALGQTEQDMDCVVLLTRSQDDIDDV